MKHEPDRSRIGTTPFTSKGRRRGFRFPLLVAWAAVFLSLPLVTEPLVAQTPAPASAPKSEEHKADAPKDAKPLPRDFPGCRDLFRTGRYADCIQACTQAMTREPWTEGFRVLAIQSQMELGKYPDALKSFEEALGRFPNSIQIRWAGRDVCRMNGQAERVAKLDDEIEQLLRQAPWRYSDAPSQVVLGRYFLVRGLDPKAILDRVYNQLKKFQPTLVDTWLASGDLALEKHDYALAAEAFAKAAKLDPNEPEAHFGLAKAFLPSDNEKASESLEATLKLNANHVNAQLLLIENAIDAEQYAKADVSLEEVFKINPHHPRAWAYKAVIAHLRNQPDAAKAHRQAALKHWPTNPEVDHLIGRKLSQKYRFAEGSKLQRQALAFDPKYRPARIQLAQDLLRLGEEDEGWRLAGEVSAEDSYDVVAHNLVTLRDNIDKFRTLEGGGFILRMEASEAEIYGHRVLALLQRAKETLCRKYDVTLEKPVIVEMFPKQQDFAIRTFGLPGGAGFLGVCFGTVITANSPASQGESPACWESTLWHEFCHVVTLNKTHNKMPRWLSEGISVYEERQADPTWGERIKPAYRQMLLGDELTPVSELSGAFLHPRSGLHLQFAYFESSLVVEYLVEKHGLETLQKILTDLGNGLPINEALDRHTGGLAALDAEFTTFAREKAEAMAPDAEWSEPELPRRATVEMIRDWVKEHPRNYKAQQRLAVQLITEKKWAEAKPVLEVMKGLYPRDAQVYNPYSLLAAVHRALKENREERAVLEELVKLTDDDVDAFSRLAELAVEAEDWNLTKACAQRWLGVNPLQPAPHRYAAQAAEQLGDHALAVDSYRALLKLDSTDPAQAHYQLSLHLRNAGDLTAARRHVLLSLEEAPRFREAHKLLLDILEKLPKNGSPTTEVKEADSKQTEEKKPGVEQKATEPADKPDPTNPLVKP